MAKVIPVVADTETFWSATHSLTKMSPIVYATHPETELISACIKVGDDVAQTFMGEAAIQKAVDSINWSDKMLVFHNASFDAMLWRWRLGVNPRLWACTLSMARPHHALTTGLSLAKLVEHYKLGVKDNTALLNTKGKHLADFTPDELQAMRRYNRDDTDQCYALFHKLLPKTPKHELQLIDMTIRMLVEPKFEVDTKLLKETLKDEQARKRVALMQLSTQLGHCTTNADEAAEFIRSELASAPKFAAMLESLGVEVPMKPSPTNPDKQVPALAKSDQAFLDLQEHPDEKVAALAIARLDVKSTMLESRIQSFLEVTEAAGGSMPIAKNYYGAHTGRWSGSMNLNQENLPRIGPKKKPSDALRNCLMAPDGHKVVVADLSGIELRVNHFLWQVPSSMALFKADPEKADLYKDFASKMYDILVDDVSKTQRQYAKACQLGLGFGAGPATFVRVAKMMGGINLSDGEAVEVVGKWREEYHQIATGWRTCHNALAAIMSGERLEIDPWGFCVTTEGGIKTPRGMVRYPNLHTECADRNMGKLEWWYGEGRNRSRIYAGRITENIVQHLARCILADNMLEIQKRYPIVHSVHDEIILVVPEEEAQDALDFMQGVMRTPPKWWPELVVWSEGSFGDTYGEAK